MTLRKWGYLFWTTMAVGAVVGLLAGVLMQLFDEEASLFGPGFGYNLLMMLLAGATISVLSQMGFFAYLIVRYFAQGMTRQYWILDILQWIIIVIALFDLVYLRYNPEEGSWLGYMIMPFVLVCSGIVVAWIKVKLTNRTAWTPTLFFMIAVTAIESVPALRASNPWSTFFMMTPLIACNAWQILILHKVTRPN